MSHNGHSAIEVLKLDIEGAEYEVLKAWAKAGTFPPFRQLLIEFHWKMFAGCGMFLGGIATRRIQLQIPCFRSSSIGSLDTGSGRYVRGTDV